MSPARKLYTAAVSALALAAAIVVPAANATPGSPPAPSSARAAKHGHKSSRNACTHPVKGARKQELPRPRSCVRDAHSSRPRRAKTKPHPQATAKRSGGGGAAAIAAVLATPCENTDVVPEAENLEAVRGAVVCLINHVRAQHGEQPLEVNAELEKAAQEHSVELVELDYFAHVSPSGETPVDRIRKMGYIPGPEFGYVIGENLAWGTLGLSTPQAIVTAWVNSPGHLANILEGQYEDTGVGIVPAVPPSLGGGQQGATYSQEFGVIIG